MTVVSNEMGTSRARATLVTLAAILAMLSAPGERVAGQSDLAVAWAFSEGSGASSTRPSRSMASTIGRRA